MKYYRNKNDVIIIYDGEDIPEGFKEITESEYNEVKGIISQLAELRFELKKTDYQAIKHSEGWITEEDYAPIKAARQALRDEINELEESLNG